MISGVAKEYSKDRPKHLSEQLLKDGSMKKSIFGSLTTDNPHTSNTTLVVHAIFENAGCG